MKAEKKNVCNKNKKYIIKHEKERKNEKVTRRRKKKRIVWE